MSGSKLGPLAALGSVRASPSSLSTAELDLDSALGELLGEEEEQREEGGDGGEEKDRKQLPVSPRSKPSQTQREASRGFCGGSFGKEGDIKDSHRMEEGGDRGGGGAPKLTDLADMEANLFSSFSQGQAQKRRGRRAAQPKQSSSPNPLTQLSHVGSSDQEELMKRSPDEEMAQVRGSGVSAAKPQAPALNTDRGSSEEKHKTSDFDDDLLDLLSDEPDEDMTRKRAHPKFHIKARPPHTSVGDRAGGSQSTGPGSHSEVHGDDPTPSDMTGRRELSGHLRVAGRGELPVVRGQELEHPQSREEPLPKKLSSGPGSLTLDGLPVGGGKKRGGGGEGIKGESEGGRVGGRGGERSRTVGRGSHTTSALDFGDEDDILSGMGLDDSDAPHKSKTFSLGGQKKGSRIVGTTSSNSQPFQDIEENRKGMGRGGINDKEEEEVGEDGEEEGESYQFGGYLPSMVSDARPTGPPSSEPRRKNLPEHRTPFSTTSHSQHKPAPNSKHDRLQPVAPQIPHPAQAEAPSKKSVHFSDETQGSLFTPSNPSTSEGRLKPALKTGERREKKEQPSPVAEEAPIPEHLHEKGSAPDRTTKEEKIDGLEFTSKNSESDSQATSVHTSSAGRQLQSTPIETSMTTALSSPTTEGAARKPQVAASEGEEERLEHPVFPWQRKKRERATTVAMEDHKATMATELQTHQSGTTVVTRPAESKSLSQPVDISSDSHGLTGQSVQVPPPLTGWGRERADEREEVKSLQQRVKELESELERENTQKKDLQARVSSLQEELEGSNQKHKTLTEQMGAVRAEKEELEASLQKKELHLNSQLEELKVKLHRAELERDQLQHSLDTSKSYHAEELTTMQKSHDARMQAVEESFQRKETRWREEMEGETTRHQERLEQLEKEKTDSVLALRKKIDGLEVAKTNEISCLQEIHRSSVGDLKREHELNQQHLKDMHRQEVEALKAAHSHTHRLSELSGLVEETAHRVSELQSKVERIYNRGLEERKENSQLHEEHLKTLEERLGKQQKETEIERQLLQVLVGKLEAHLSQQSRLMESERWALQQETTRLRAREQALEQERITSLAKLEDEKRALADTKEKFLMEQQQLLSQCLTERHSLAAERAQLTVQQRKASEREQREAQRNQEAQAELEASQTRVKEEQTRLAAETARLRLEESNLKEKLSQLEKERETLEREKKSLERQRGEVEHQAEEVENARQSAAAMYKEGEEALEAAQKLQAELSEQAEALQSQLEHIQEREMQLASERLAFAKECRELQRKSPTESDSLCSPESVLTSTHMQDSPSPVVPVSAHAHSLPPRLHGQRQAEVGDSSLQTLLSQLQQSQNFRKMAWDAEKDDLEIERESQFLRSIQQTNSFIPSDY